jgi:hypothetical protein
MKPRSRTSSRAVFTIGGGATPDNPAFLRPVSALPGDCPTPPRRPCAGLPRWGRVPRSCRAVSRDSKIPMARVLATVPATASSRLDADRSVLMLAAPAPSAGSNRTAKSCCFSAVSATSWEPPNYDFVR